MRRACNLGIRRDRGAWRKRAPAPYTAIIAETGEAVNCREQPAGVWGKNAEHFGYEKVNRREQPAGVRERLGETRETAVFG